MPVKVLKLIIFGLELLIVACITSEVFFYSDFLGLKTGLSFLIIAVSLGLILSLIHLRTHFSRQLAQFWQSNFLMLTGLTLLTGLGALLLAFFEVKKYSNFVFAHFHLHAETLYYVPLILLILLLVTWPVAFISRHYTWVIFAAPLVVVIAISPYVVSHFPSAVAFSAENGPIENITVVLLAAASGLSFSSAFLLLKKPRRNYILASFFILMSLLFLFVAGEEMAWGQFLFETEVFDSLKAANIQNEATIHNLPGSYDLSVIGMMVIGAVGACGWFCKSIFRTFCPWLKVGDYLVSPEWFTSLYFWPVFIYGFYRAFIWFLDDKIWEEVAELLLAVGLVIMFGYFYRQIKVQLRLQK